MKIFAYSYADGENLSTSFNLGVFGAPDDDTGLGTKVRQLEIGDLLLIRLTDKAYEESGTLQFAPLCRVVGRVFDQRDESPFRDYLWPDEVERSEVLYPFAAQSNSWDECDRTLRGPTWTSSVSRTARGRCFEVGQCGPPNFGAMPSAISKHGLSSSCSECQPNGVS